ncbi:MAG: nucleotidyltransferase domain-containing protein, partial [Candidatus Woesearchaeota archaeon]
GVAHTSVKKNLTELARLGIIKESFERKGVRKFPVYMADMENKLYKRYKVIHNMLAILESGLVEFIADSIMPKSIVLFGSYKNGEDVEDSDIDLFVGCVQEKLDLKKFERKLHRAIELHFNRDFSAYPSELKNNIVNGVVLSGYLEVYK